ncbi:MAG: GGDEF domain-containing protein [Terracidiphilus sp.]
MKSVIAAVLLVLGWVPAALAAAPGGLTKLREVHSLTNAEASLGIPVAFEATVSYSRGYEGLLFVQDGDVAIFVAAPTRTNYMAGDRILIKGVMRASFRPIVIGKSIVFLRHGPALKPIPSTFDQLIQGKLDAMMVTLRAKVRAADMVVSAAPPVRSARLQLVTDGGHFEANVDSDDESSLSGMVDAEVEISGVAAGKFDDKMQQTGVLLYVPALSNVKVLTHASASPWSYPITPMDRVLSVYHVQDLTQRVRVHGVVTYYQPGTAVVLQDGTKSMWISTHAREPLQIGDLADATGFPDAHDRLLTLTDGEFQDTHISSPVKPQPATWQQLGFWSSSSPDGHEYDLVSIEGQVRTEAREATQDEYVLESGGRLFTAIYHHPRGKIALAPMLQVPAGSRIRVTGICTMLDTNSVNPGGEASFNILLRSFDDIAIVARPTVVNVRNLIILVGVLMVVVLIFGARGRYLDLKVKRQALAMAARIESEATIERRRSAILEDINGKRPLVEILKEITELVSFRLGGVPCWCQVADGSEPQRQPSNAENLRIVREQIPVRSVSPLGEIFAGLDRSTEPGSNESEVLSMGAGLAFLAIESRRVYSDLFHRSEFDLLTGLHNRFSFERRLKAVIEEDPQRIGAFGLIYIDVDNFKSVNDNYGHRIGDLYLQAAALRMKRQLRNVDLLARHGGDEFTVFVPAVHSTDVEEITGRLKRCFDDPYLLEGCTFTGSASIGVAIYPEDGESIEALLSTADAAMYVAKHTRHQTESEFTRPSR